MTIAVHHAQAVISIHQEAVSTGELRDVKAQLPRKFDLLFDKDTRSTQDR